jgi:hypothetical protein
MADWKNPKTPVAPAAKPAAPGAPGGAAAVPKGAPAGSGTPVGSPGPAAKGAPGAPGAAGAAPEAKPGFLNKLLGKTTARQGGRPGRPPKEEAEKKPKKEPLTPEEIKEGAQVAADVEIDLFSTLLGNTFLAGKYLVDDIKVLRMAWAAWIERYQIKMPWWITFWRGQIAYIGARVRDPKNQDAVREVFGWKKKPKEITVKVVEPVQKSAESV